METDNVPNPKRSTRQKILGEKVAFNRPKDQTDEYGRSQILVTNIYKINKEEEIKARCF